MKILLIHPPTNKKVIGGEMIFVQEPLSLEYIGAGVRDYNDVKILDMRIDNSFEQTMNEFVPDIVGITGYTHHVNPCKQILQRVKAINSNILTVIGGHHATVMPESFCEKYIDVIVIGEGVYTFKEIIEKFERKEDTRAIGGIAIPENGKLHITPGRTYTELDNLPFPDRSLTARYRENYYTLHMRPLASIRSSVGCAFTCKFCALWQITGKRYITRSPENVIKELLTIKEPHALFADDETFLNIKRMDLLASLIKEAGIKKKYVMSVRSDTIVRNPKLIEKWKEIGLSVVRVGFESFHDDELKSFNKKSSTAINEEAMHILEKRNIAIGSQFIVSQDYDRKKFKQLGDYVRRHKLKRPVFSVLTPLPGTILYEEVKDKMISKDYELYDFKHTLLPTKLPLKEFYAELAKLRIRLFPIWKYILFRYLLPITQLIPFYKAEYKIISSMKNAYKDYS